MHNQTLTSSERMLCQIDAAAAVLMTLRWGVDHCLVDDDLAPFVAIARTMTPAARAALESVDESPARSHVRAALDALSHVEWLVHPELPEAGFDRVIAIADPSIERCKIAIDAAQALLRTKARHVSRSTGKSLRGRSAEESSSETYSHCN